ncbi:MAG: ABC transporter substrate-binding protein [Betaproteobacteria bacterium]|nr:ABC transporter substrate-binding protein [Betaproteobacteria bacterium]
MKFLFGALLLSAALASEAATELKVLVGGQHRPDVFRELLREYSQLNPGVTITLEVGGATSELLQRYLNTLLSARDSSLDVFLIDVVRPAQFAAAGWAEPLDAHLGADREAMLASYLPRYRAANTVAGRLQALPAFSDAMYLYYRKDLLAKHGVAPPTTWPELAAAAKKILAAERDPNLQGLSFQGRAIEGAVCTFLLPYWSLGGEVVRDGKLAFDRAKAEAGIAMWQDMIRQGVAKPNVAEVGTDDTRKEFQAGKAVFAVLWGYGWNLFQTGKDTRVTGKVGVVRLPAMPGGEAVSCLGGWNWAVSAYSRHKAEAARLVTWLSGAETSKKLALRASLQPVHAHVFRDPEVLAAVPWFADALPVVETAVPRPVTPMYRPVSDAIRLNLNAVLAGARSPKQALDEIEHRVGRALR